MYFLAHITLLIVAIIGAYSLSQIITRRTHEINWLPDDQKSTYLQILEKSLSELVETIGVYAITGLLIWILLELIFFTVKL